ncbi:unnamed protein product [Ceutorhynchus assimilis]|uniref:Ribosomal protein eL8/eL30/eS12/Gadd45 domain-containing protein n=1 Tax=Ceutorhynchus assimilis TaxID=467358 RepID=A0A9N9N3Z2_9CUCU|nr:unnamed protein product [Ceutorhynchus assimilis]
MPPQTPTLTKKQQKATLSAKKGKTKVTIRNVLATPFKKYWPLVSQDQATILHEAISKELPKIVLDKLKIPWQELKKIPKQERKQKQPTQEIRQGLAFGINDTSKAIEKGIASSILIANEVKPKLMVEHLLDSSVLLRIPTLVVPGLRDILKTTCGISSAALALTDTEKFKELQLIVKNLHEKYPVPKRHINYQRSLIDEDQTNNQSVVVIEDEDCPKTTEDSVIVVEDPMVVIDDDNEKSTVYLYRDSKNKRVFVPSKSDAGPIIGEVATNLFLSLCDVDSPPKKLYKSLKVRRIKGNHNRNKMKIGQIKEKRTGKKKKKKQK